MATSNEREKEPFQASLVALNGSVIGSRGRGYLVYMPLGGGTPGQAWNMGRVQERANVPVWIGYFKDEPVILHIDRSRLEPNGERGYRSPLFSQHAPDHGWGSGDPDYVDTRRIKDLQVKPDGGLTVKTLPGWYTIGGTDLYFPGQQGINLASYQPTAAGVKRGVGLYLDADKTVKLVSGNQIARTAGGLPEPVWPDGAFKLVVVILYGGKDFVDFEDVKQRKQIWTGGGGGWPFLSILPVTTEAELLAAITTASINDLILVDDDITIISPINISASCNIGSFGAITGHGIYKSTGRIFNIVDVDPGGRVRFLNLSIVGGFTGTATDIVYIENANVEFLNVRIFSEGMGDADACLVKILSDVVGVARQVTFTNTTVICTDPISSGYGVIITDTAADLGTHVIVQGGEVEAPDYEFRVDGSAATLALMFPITGGSIELLNGGTWEGRYFLGDGTILPIDAKIQVTAADTASEYLSDKINAGTNLNATVVDTGSGVEDLVLDVPDASSTVKGAVELATDAETQTGTDTARAITPANLTARTATDTRTGVIELATQAEVNTGTDTERAVTPATLTSWDKKPVMTENLLADTLTHEASWLAGTTFNDLADDNYGPSLWNILNDANAPDVAGTAGGSTDPFTRYLAITLDATTRVGAVQFLTAEKTRPYRGQVVSLSADLWATGITAVRMAVIVWTSTADTVTSDVVGTWGSNPTLATNWAFIGTPADITISTTRTRFSVQNLTIPTNAVNLGVFIWTPSQEASTDVLNIARVKLEPGAAATDFVGRDPGQGLALIEDFYQQSYNVGTFPGAVTEVGAGRTRVNSTIAASTAGVLHISFYFPKRMRATPAITFYSTTGASGAIRNGSTALDRTGTTAFVPSSIGSSAFNVSNASANALTSGDIILWHWVADARL